MGTEPLSFTGFDPQAIRLRIHVEVVEQHAGEGAFVWSQRWRATSSPKHRLVDLARLDRRLEAHLRGLVVAGRAGWAACQAVLGEGIAEVFPAAVVALHQPARTCWSTVLEAVQANPKTEPALVSALGWVPWALAEPRLRELDVSEVPLLQHAAIAAYAAHRRLPEPALERARTNGGVRVLARALRAVGETAMTQALPMVERYLQAGDPGVRGWAAWSLLLSAPAHSMALATLTSLVPPAGEHGDVSEAAVDMLARSLGPIAGAALYRDLVAAGHGRLALVAALAGGWPEVLDAVIADMADAKRARLAGLVFTQTTGLDLNLHDLEGDPPEEDDDDDPRDLLLPWPHPARVAARWEKERGRYAPRQRYLRGESLNEATIAAVLRLGTQPQRRSAAVERSRLRPGTPLYPTARSGLEQARELLGWT